MSSVPFPTIAPARRFLLVASGRRLALLRPHEQPVPAPAAHG
ncbi:hypothetical protein SAMN04489712_11227 [Thermomonospora echinospora]|uniref:Uncharacterized protein n=1 Tax=Thermomonospora echinospora TaxID=1992 RepID=A0A1H6CZU3_9ACTN|nr:hypothetical protein [Thermomonospora echinospora]SEG78095.1 hypothetical protein SAMN04489712_11227 [Thermomonospora echinospora]